MSKTRSFFYIPESDDELCNLINTRVQDLLAEMPKSLKIQFFHYQVLMKEYHARFTALPKHEVQNGN